METENGVWVDVDNGDPDDPLTAELKAVAKELAGNVNGGLCSIYIRTNRGQTPRPAAGNIQIDFFWRDWKHVHQMSEAMLAYAVLPAKEVARMIAFDVNRIVAAQMCRRKGDEWNR